MTGPLIRKGALDTSPPTATGRVANERTWNRSASAFGLLLCSLLAACDSGNFAEVTAPVAHAATERSSGKTLGYVLASYDYLNYQTQGAKEECPRGFTPNNREQWQAQFPTPAEQSAQLSRCLGINNRGPSCENVWAAPQVVEDPLPYHSVEGKKSFGVNLDGTSDGAATATTCKHEKFVSPEGELGIDNQYYRFIGCERFVQGGQHHAPANAKKRTIQYQISRVLLELTGVDDERNDPDVAGTLYRGKDQLMVDAMENAVPFQSQRIDEDIPPIHLKGKIADGVLTTEPTDVIWEGVLHERRLLLRGMSLRLKLEGVKAEGLRVGYVDIDRLWLSYSRIGKWGGGIYGGSGPAAYKAMHELADGFKDPKTGQCTALSSARKFDFVRAYIIHPGGETTQ
jgi:hypothetical protein